MSYARNVDGTRRFDPESNVLTTSRDAHVCHVCRRPTEPGVVAHRTYSTLYAHAACAALNPQGWHIDPTAGCWDCRQSFRVREMVVDPTTAHFDDNSQIRRCSACATARGVA